MLINEGYTSNSNNGHSVLVFLQLVRLWACQSCTCGRRSCVNNCQNILNA